MLKVGIWYLFYQQYDPQWKDSFRPGIELATQRLASYTGTSWPYQFVGEHQIHELVLVDGIGVTKALDAVRHLAQAGLISKAQYEAYDLPVFIFAGTNGAFSVDYQSPIYGSDDMMVRESQIQTLIEHEIGHAFGMPDHMRPFANPQYEFCIQGNLYLGQVQYCSECAPKLKLSNYRKLPYAQLAGTEELLPPEPERPEPPFTEIWWEGAYGLWGGRYIDLRELIKSWPATVSVPTVWKLGVRADDISLTASIDFFGGSSGVYILQPNAVTEIYLTVPPKAKGLYNTESVVKVGSSVLKESVSVNVVEQAVSPPGATGLLTLVLVVGLLGISAAFVGRKDTRYLKEANLMAHRVGKQPTLVETKEGLQVFFPSERASATLSWLEPDAFPEIDLGPGKWLWFNRLINQSGKPRLGTMLLDAVLSHCEKNQYSILNEVSAYGALSQRDLEKWYMSKGFKPADYKRFKNALLVWRPAK